MIDLSTDYLGLKLENPLVPSSSPLTGEIDSARQLEDAGAGALIMPSLFEQAIQREQKLLEQFVHCQALGSYEAQSYQPVPDDYTSELDAYLQKIEQLKSALDIPVIASLNGISASGWIDHGKDLQQAGADALELNVYYIAADPEKSGAQVEDHYLRLLGDLREHITIPVTMKLSSQFSSVTNMVRKLEDAGVNGAVLFNRFYQPDIDLETLEIKPHLELSTPMESLLRIRWIALIRSHVELSIAATGGFHKTDDIIKALLAGADVTYLCSVLLQQGIQHLTTLKQQLHDWLEENEYESVQQMKGSVSKSCAINPEALEHNNYMHVIKSYR
jgi:dihydroorotate dehydrogenase (fumarate)